jgi:hypothetical protein
MDSQDKPIVTQALSDHLGVWQRLAPISILYFVGSTLKAVVGNMLFVLPAFAISFSQFSQAPLLWLSGLSVFILLLPISIAKRQCRNQVWRASKEKHQSTFLKNTKRKIGTAFLLSYDPICLHGTGHCRLVTARS